MIIDIVTLFPGMFDGFLNESIIKRAIADNLVTVNIINLRDFTLDKHKHVDDTPYGGGAGMVLKCQPMFDCLKSLKSIDTKTILMTPQGKTFSQNISLELSKEKHIILVCGHYEGFDERIRSKVDLELSIGDYVLTGGELPAMVISDSIIRLINGAIKEESHMYDSFQNGLLEHPHYTKPAEYEGMSVPLVLINGNHKLIDEWRRKESLKNTYNKRPDLLKNYDFTVEEKQWVEEFINESKEN